MLKEKEINNDIPDQVNVIIIPHQELKKKN